MIEWLQLPLAVLLSGLGVGSVAALILGKRSRAAGAPDLTLRLSDLELRRDELYARLQGVGGEAPAGEDRRQLELAAARVLRELDELGAKGRRKAARKARASAGAEPVPASAGSGFTQRHPLLSGALLGGGVVGLVAVLIFLAQGDAKVAPTQPSTSAPAAASGGGGMPANGIDRGEPPLPPAVAAQVAELQAEIEKTGDLDSRRQLAELLLGHQQMFEAFQQAKAILEANPEDPTGHYVSGVVRYTMGQVDSAVQELDAAVAADPSFSQALLIKGVLLLQTGDREGAIASWQQGLEAAGGSEPRLEHLLALAKQGLSADEILSAPSR